MSEERIYSLNQLAMITGAIIDTDFEETGGTYFRIKVFGEEYYTTQYRNAVRYLRQWVEEGVSTCTVCGEIVPDSEVHLLERLQITVCKNCLD